jgi:tetratricopeptide (TPR) repeat protein
MRGWRRLLPLLLIPFFGVISSCTLFSEDPLSRAKDLVSRGQKKEAVTYLLKEIDSTQNSKESLEWAQYGAQVAHLQLRDYPSAITFYRYLLNYSDSSDEQLGALRSLGMIYFDQLKDYQRSIEIFETMVRFPLPKEEKAKYKLLLAKSHYNLAQIHQAEAELKAFRDLKPSNSMQYEGDVFESNLLVSKKEHEKAAALLKRLIQEFPERARSDGLEMNLVACYEDMKNFDAAIQAMNDMKKTYPDPEFLEMRIDRLRERKDNMPGAKGLKK